MLNVRFGFSALALLATIVATTTPAAAQTQAPAGGPPVQVAHPVVKDVQETVTFTGRFDATQTIQVKSRVPGYLEKIAFVDGSLVRRSDLLFTIDQRPYQAAVDQAAAALTVSQTTLQFASSDLERAVQLQKTGNITDQMFDQRRQAFLQAQARVAGDTAALAAARLNYEFTEIRAPIDGKISRRLISEGNLIGAADTLLTTIVSLDPIDFYFDVDETTFLAFERAAFEKSGNTTIAGLTGSLATTDEPAAKRRATVDFVDNRVDQASGTMRLRAKVANPNMFLTPGLFGRIVLPMGGPKRGVLVPDEAIASDQTRRIVYTVAADGAVSPKQVMVGPKIDGYRLVRSGLDGSETIVVNGIVRIRPGVKVTPQPIELPPTKTN